MRVIKIVSLILFFSVSAFAADKPTRTVKTKTLELPEYKSYSPYNLIYRPEYKIHFTSNDEIMICFFQRNTQSAPEGKSTTETSEMSFVVLLLSKEEGKLISKKEWPIAGEPSWEQRLKYAIYPLPNGGYAALFDGHMQVLDSSFNTIHDRLLDRLPQGYRYGISVPAQGTAFVLDSGVEYELINFNTFKTVGSLNASIPIRDIWGDKLLLRSIDREDGIMEGLFQSNDTYNLYERKIGGSYGGYHLKINTQLLRDEKFIYNGNVIILSRAGYTYGRQDYWFTIENGKTGNPVFVGEKRRFNDPGEGIGSALPARQAPVVAVSAHKHRSFDRGNYYWLEVYDTNTGQKILETKTYNQGIYCALSADGRTLVVFIEEKGTLEFYKVPAASGSKNN